MAAPATTIGLRQRLQQRLADARARTDDIFRIVRPEALYDRPVAERHRIIFYLGHLEAFDWNLLGRELLGLPSFHGPFDRLFAFGIDPVGGGLPSDKPADWPDRPEVERYNRRVRDTLDEQLQAAPFNDPAQPLLRNGFLVEVAIEHRLMHAETLAYMLHQLPLERKVLRPILRTPRAPRLPTRMVEIPAGEATLGLRRADSNGNGLRFGWDNEFEERRVQVPAFAMDVANVTNRDWLQFVREGGYQNRAFWTDDDWNWKETAEIRRPFFWFERGGETFYRGMFVELPLPLVEDWPVYVSHAEASAYVRWAGKSLPTEAEFHRAAYGTPNGGEREYPWGNEAPPPEISKERFGNFDFVRWEPAPVGSSPAGNSAFGVADLLGNGWEWTSTVFGPFPGFEAFPFYKGYSASFFDGKHYVMKGGSARTATCMLRRSFRNWFQPHYPYVYAAFRCVQR